MGIFKKHDQSVDNDDNIILKSDFAPVDIDVAKAASESKYFDENIGFETGALKSSFTDIKDNSETLDIIKNKVVKNKQDKESSNEVIDDDLPYYISDTEPNDNKDNYESLLEKCKAYTVDENGNDFSKDDDSLYELISVAEILRTDQLKSLDNITKKYNIQLEDKSVDDQYENLYGTEKPKTADDTVSIESDDNKTPGFVKLTQSDNRIDDTDDSRFEEYIKKKNPNVTVEELDSNIPDLSDIDNTQKMNVSLHDHSTDGATLKYIPIKDPDGNESRISITSTTQNIDLSEKLNLNSHESSDVTVKKDDPSDDFDDFTVSEEINDKKDLLESIKKTSIKKRTAFLSLTASIILSIITLFVSLSNSKDQSQYSKGTLIFLLSSYALNCAANFEMFKSIPLLFKKVINPDLTATVLSIGTALMSLTMILQSDINFAADVYLLISTSSLLLSMRSLSSFFAVSSRLGNLKAVSSRYDVYGVSFIDDQSIAYSIAKDSVEGDILIAAPHRTRFVNSFNRYSLHTSLLSGRFSIFQIFGFAISIMIGALGFAKFHSFTGVMYCVISLLCILAFPALFFINSLPCYSASKKLNRIGASIFGTAAAKQLDNANAVVISTEELFPSGSIVLKDLKILSENNINDTILRATSLTESVGSPLTPIFKKIAKTDATYSLPDSDTVKYEDKLGISGWVDNELLFIGNRTLMESHGIEVPSIEVDKRILRNGCFPIYVATVQKACALLIVKYNPKFEIARELRKLSGLGVTLLFVNSDPNINESMISDYFDIYEDCIKIVSNAGKYMYENTVISREPMPSPATFKRKNLAFVKIMNCASAIKKSNNLFSIMYILVSVLLAVGFIYLKFASDSTFFSSRILLFTEIIATIVSLIFYLFKKP